MSSRLCYDHKYEVKQYNYYLNKSYEILTMPHGILRLFFSLGMLSVSSLLIVVDQR